MKKTIIKISKVLRGPELQKYLFNTSWMLGEKVFTMSIAMLASIFVARYLGPERFGILSYAVSLSSLFAIATHMGLGGLAVRELVNKPDKSPELIGTIFGLKLFGALFALIIYLLFIFFSENRTSIQFWVLVLVSGTIFLKPFEVFDFWFQSKVMVKYSSLVRGISKISGALVKISLVLITANLIAFASIYLLEAFLAASLFISFFIKKSDFSVRSWRFNFSRAKSLLGEGWMLMLGAVFAIVYLKIDQVMIKWLMNTEEVGIYSVAVKLSETWYFIPTAIVSSLFPKLLELKKEDQEKLNDRLQYLLNLLFLIAFSLAIIITFVSEPVIKFLYGVEFHGAALILTVHIWAGVFIFMRAAFSKWILIENAIVFSVITQGLGALANIVINLFLIPKYGGVGAAIATIISYAMASYFALLFYKKSRPIFWMMTKAIFSPFLIFKKIR